MNNKTNIKMRELPETERPYEKCLAAGPEILSNAELIAVLLKSGNSGESAVDLAKRLMCIYESEHTLADIFSSSIEELTEISGIGQVKAITLKCVGELCARLSRETPKNRVKLNRPDLIAGYYMETMRHLNQEEIHAALFDTKSYMLRDIHLTTGTVNASLITSREVFVKCLKYHPVYLVLVHNHPSGDPEPSAEDLIITTKLKEAGEILGVPLVDHIIIGDNRYVSMKDKGIL